MGPVVVLVFALVYLGMALGRVPGLALDRTGLALLGAIGMVTCGALTVEQAWAAVDMPTIYLLFALMVVSAQFRLAGFYSWVVRRAVALRANEAALLAAVIALAGALSSVLTNDVVCLAAAPVLIEGCGRRRLNPVPFLLGLACGSNIGSAATLIGNPQNILIGQKLGLSFTGFLFDAGVPSVLGLAATWAILVRQYRGRWAGEGAPSVVQAPPFDHWQSAKALLVAGGLMLAFLLTPQWPRHGVALAGAGVLLLSRRMASREMLSLVDWQLLVLFIGLFIVNGAFAQTGAVAVGLARLEGMGIDARQPAPLFLLSAVLSNLVSNVPATMLLLPAATFRGAGPVLALSSTLAGNLFIVGSIANIIVVSAAQSFGVRIDFRTHFKTGLPVTGVTLLIAAAWLTGRGLVQ